MKKQHLKLLFSPSDLVRYVQSPFASWMQRLCLEVPEKQLLKNSLLIKFLYCFDFSSLIKTLNSPQSRKTFHRFQKRTTQ